MDRPRATRLSDLLDRAAAEYPDSPAITDHTGSWTYRELDNRVRALAGWLRDQGIGRGDRVLVRLPNVREMSLALFGITRIGAIFVPINPAMKEFHLRGVIADAEPALILTDGRTAAEVGKLTDAPVHDLGEVSSLLETHAHGTADAEPEDVGVLIYTSGSTAGPKGVVCPQAQMVFSADAIDAVLGHRQDDVVFCRVPLSFDYGLYQLIMACQAGAHVVLSGSRPDYKLLSDIAESGATVVPVVPSMGAMLVWLSEREQAVPAVRMITSTGAALPQATIDGLRVAFPNAVVVRMYGTTECKRITVMPPAEEAEREGSVGPALPGTNVVIVDANGTPLPVGEIGEITVTGPNVMAGYWRAPELSAKTFRWDAEAGVTRLHTGDYGRLDEDGYVYFDGRRDDMFKRKGVRMSTLEIEAAAMDVDGVRKAAVLPPTEDRDLTICVESDLGPGAVLRALAKRLESAKVPAVCHVFEQFPLTPNGKNSLKELRALVESRSS
ncbi:peptide synthetase [Actinosynnema sp. ALI-1.44]|nr:peptide synthetase [Actinosynnema sp. ALI-1.44]